jgi:hypothetical protein
MPGLSLSWLAFSALTSPALIACRMTAQTPFVPSCALPLRPQVPTKIDIGPVYTVDPRQRAKYAKGEHWHARRPRCVCVCVCVFE